MYKNLLNALSSSKTCKESEANQKKYLPKATHPMEQLYRWKYKDFVFSIEPFLHNHDYHFNVIAQIPKAEMVVCCWSAGNSSQNINVLLKIFHAAAINDKLQYFPFNLPTHYINGEYLIDFIRYHNIDFDIIADFDFKQLAAIRYKLSLGSNE